MQMPTDSPVSNWVYMLVADTLLVGMIAHFVGDRVIFYPATEDGAKRTSEGHREANSREMATPSARSESILRRLVVSRWGRTLPPGPGVG
jgi:hypothetical protein